MIAVRKCLTAGIANAVDDFVKNEIMSRDRRGIAMRWAGHAHRMQAKLKRIFPHFNHGVCDFPSQSDRIHRSKTCQFLEGG